MRAIVLTGYGGVENFALAEVADPEPGPHDIRVQLRAASFNPIDYQIRRGGHESKLVSSPSLGRDFAGVVNKVGAAVTEWAVGDAVFGYSSSMGSNGTYAEQLCVPATIVGRVPASLTFAQAPALPVAGLTALAA
ncbi:MAG: alcohol dehydrogenase catalytic domain-containing protein, partial [Ferruginibacter sp.]|nr:alcohol dehydrogenase catalytic domain-containing protein [Cytophagales bacterium]